MIYYVIARLIFSVIFCAVFCNSGRYFSFSSSKEHLPCNRQVELNTLSQIRFNNFPQLRLNTFFFKQRSSIFHPDTVLAFIKGDDFTSMEEAI